MYSRIVFLCGLIALACGSTAPAAEQVPAFTLKKLFIASSEEKVAALPVESGGDAPVHVADVAVLQSPDFPALIAPFIGKPVTLELANALASTIDQYLKKHDRPLVKYPVPTGDPATGIIRMAVVITQFKDIQFPRKSRWFPPDQLQRKLGIKPGDDVTFAHLEEAVNWANTNPFRQIKVLINELKDQPGKADLIVGVDERIPVRLTLSAADSGTRLVGDYNYTAALQFGNLWGRDHQGSYQYSTTDDRGVLQSHAVDYRWPLPWRHYIQFSGGYSTVKPHLTDFTFDGKNLNAAARYIYPVRGGTNPIEFTAGLDFKEGNNTILYGSYKFEDASKTNQVIQFTTAISAVYRDKHGAWLFGVNLNTAPGNLTSYNRKSQFQRRDNAGNYATEVRYLSGTLSAQRMQNLSKDWSLFSRLAIQVSSANLPGSEQLSIGGSTTVRGYNERIETGDEGMVFSNDLQTPALRTTLPFLKKRPPLESRLTAFYDFGTVSYKFPEGADQHQKPLASAGIGLRMSLPVNFSLTADYGWQLTERATQINGTRLDPEQYHGRGHVKVVLAF